MTDRASAAPVGLIAGQGRLPILVAEGMRDAGRRVVCVGLHDNYDAATLPPLCDHLVPAGLTRIGKWIRTFRRAGVHEAVMVGRVAKVRMHDPLKLIRHFPDWRAIDIWYRRLRHDRRNAAVLSAIADALDRNGITLIDSTTYIPDHLASQGVMGAVHPTAKQEADLAFGWSLLTRTVELDIGQTIAVRDRDVIAVEAVEGTDAMIERAGELCRANGWTLLKTSKSSHDQRSDVPTIGVETIERLARCGGTCAALGAGRVILIDKPDVINAANQHGVTLVGIPSVELAG